MLDDAAVWNEEVGAFLSEKHRRFAEILQDYEPTLSLSFIPPLKRGPEDTHPYAVIHSPGNAPAYAAMLLTEAEMENPQEVLSRLFLNDSQRSDPLANLEAMEAANQAFKLHEQAEREEAHREFAETVLKSPLHTFRHGGKKYT